MDQKKIFKKTKNLFLKLKTDPASIIFAEETLDARLLQKRKNQSIGQMYYYINVQI